MKKKVKTGLLLLVIALTAALVWTTRQVEARGKGNPLPQKVVYVTSQGLYYDTIITADPLPPEGPFQDLFLPGANPDWPGGGTLSTEFGPGDPGYVGGRWRGPLPDNPDHYFSCPLLGPGREEL
jgi:hypothetical protein